MSLYTELAHLTPSPVIELNRAVAVSMAHGPQAGLTLVDALASEPSLAHYHLFPSVRADLLYKLGRHPEARTEFERAAALTRNTRERDLLLNRAASCETDPTNPYDPAHRVSIVKRGKGEVAGISSPPSSKRMEN